MLLQIIALIVTPILLARVVSQWRSARDRWRSEVSQSLGEGAYRTHTLTHWSAPHFPKRIALLSFCTSLWGVATLLLAIAGLLLLTPVPSGEHPPLLVGLAACSGLFLGVRSLIVASRIMQRTDCAPHTIRTYTYFGIAHHLAVACAFALSGERQAGHMPFVLICCVLGLCLTLWVNQGARHAFVDVPPAAVL